MEASFPTSALGNDLRHLQMLRDFQDNRVGTAAFNKLSSHMVPFRRVCAQFVHLNVHSGMTMPLSAKFTLYL